MTLGSRKLGLFLSIFTCGAISSEARAETWRCFGWPGGFNKLGSTLVVSEPFNYNSNPTSVWIPTLNQNGDTTGSGCQLESEYQKKLAESRLEHQDPNQPTAYGYYNIIPFKPGKSRLTDQSRAEQTASTESSGLRHHPELVAKECYRQEKNEQGNPVAKNVCNFTVSMIACGLNPKSFWACKKDHLGTYGGGTFSLEPGGTYIIPTPGAVMTCKGGGTIPTLTKVSQPIKGQCLSQNAPTE